MNYSQRTTDAKKDEKTMLRCRYTVNGLIPETILERLAVDVEYYNEVFATRLS